MENNNPIDEVLGTALKNIRSLADVNTVIGKPVTSEDGKTIIPVSKVTIGFVAGGGEYGELDKFSPEHPFAGGSGGAVQLSPIGFLVGGKGEDLRMIDVDSDTNFARVFDVAKTMFERATQKMSGGSQSEEEQ